MFSFSSVAGRLSRVTSSGNYIKEIDGLRFLAIATVVIQHVNERFLRNAAAMFTQQANNSFIGDIAQNGFIGVYIFFVVSGFVLAMPFAASKITNGKEVSLKSYFWRRLTRLEVPYLFWTTIFFIIYLFAKNEQFATNFYNYLASITYTHGLFFKDWSPFNPSSWTLEVEIQFYIIAPFLALSLFSVAQKWPRRILIVAAILLVLFLQSVYLPNEALLDETKDLYKTVSLMIGAHLHYFLLGFLLVDFYLLDWKTIKHYYVYDGLALLASFLMLNAYQWNFVFANRAAFALSLSVLMICAFKSVLFNAVLKNKYLTTIGGMCYTIYLIHLPLAELFVKYSSKFVFTSSYEVNLLLQVLFFVPILLILSSFFFLLIEKPCMNKDWPTKILAKFAVAKSKYVN